MYVIDVLPLLRTAPDTLSYRSSTKLPIGSIVDITVRKTKTQGIVLSTTPVREAKGMLKTATFQLSKSLPTLSGPIPQEILTATDDTAQYFATSAGSVLAAMFSEHVRLSLKLSTYEFEPGSEYIKLTCELPLEDRAEEYKKHIDEMLAKDRATLLITPTIAELLYWEQTFSQYSPITISGEHTASQRSRAVLRASTSKALIICTPSFAWTPVQALGLIIVDRISAGTYTLPKRPYICVPYASVALARARHISIMFGDYPLPLEYRSKISSPLVSRSTESSTGITVVDVRRKKPTEDQIRTVEDDAPWKIFPDAIHSAIEKELSLQGNVIVLATRKRYAPAVVCKDCGQAQTDERGLPYMFVTNKGVRRFITSDGHSETSAKRTCQRCESWNLLPLGIGIERVEEELKKTFPNVPLCVVAPERKSKRAMKELIEQAFSGSSIVIGTEALLPWLYTCGVFKSKRPPLGVISSADSLLVLPFWRSRERFIRLALYMSGICKKLYVLTRHPDDTAVKLLNDLHSSSFWKEESLLRKAVHFPPYGTLILLSIQGTADFIEKSSTELFEQFKKYSPTKMTIHAVGKSLQQSVVLTITEGEWPNSLLSRQIGALPPYVRVRIDPDTLW